MAQLVTLDEAAIRLKLGRRTLQRWIQQGNLTRYRGGGDRKVYVDLAQVKKLLKPQPR